MSGKQQMEAANSVSALRLALNTHTLSPIHLLSHLVSLAHLLSLRRLFTPQIFPQDCAVGLSGRLKQEECGAHPGTIRALEADSGALIYICCCTSTKYHPGLESTGRQV